MLKSIINPIIAAVAVIALLAGCTPALSPFDKFYEHVDSQPLSNESVKALVGSSLFPHTVDGASGQSGNMKALASQTFVEIDSASKEGLQCYKDIALDYFNRLNDLAKAEARLTKFMDLAYIQQTDLAGAPNISYGEYIDRRLKELQDKKTAWVDMNIDNAQADIAKTVNETGLGVLGGALGAAYLMNNNNDGLYINCTAGNSSFVGLPYNDGSKTNTTDNETTSPEKEVDISASLLALYYPASYDVEIYEPPLTNGGALLSVNSMTKALLDAVFASRNASDERKTCYSDLVSKYSEISHHDYFVKIIEASGLDINAIPDDADSQSLMDYSASGIQWAMENIDLNELKDATSWIPTQSDQDVIFNNLSECSTIR